MYARLKTLLLATSLAVTSALATETLTRELPWDGSESLVIDIPAHVRYIQAPGPGSVVVTGPRKSVESFSCDGGVLRDRRLRTGTILQVIVTAPKITRFYANGGDQLSIESFEQDELHIETAGRADITVSGRAKTVLLNLQGFGWANLSRLQVQGAEITLTGSRRAIIAPEAWAKVSGQGVVILLTQPATLTQNFKGGGRVIHATRETTSSGTSLALVAVHSD